jgi:mannose-6-phosphate isomerase-like protein (cupin superfamily)
MRGGRRPADASPAAATLLSLIGGLVSAAPVAAHPQAGVAVDAEADEPRSVTGTLTVCAEPGLPTVEFSDPPVKPHDPAAFVFKFDQLSHFYRKPGEYTYRLDGDAYGFDALSFIITETHVGAGPGLHVHDTEEAHVLLEGTAEYRIGDKTFTVTGPYVARVPAGTPHTFINAGTAPFRLVAVFGSKHPATTRIGPNPLVAAPGGSCGRPRLASAPRRLPGLPPTVKLNSIQA